MSLATDSQHSVPVGELSDEHRRMFVDALPYLAWMANPDGYIHWFNRSWHEYTGTTLEQMRGWGWHSVHDPKVLPEVVAHFGECTRRGEPFEMVFPLRGADGQYRHFLTRAVPYRDKNGAIIQWVGVNTDVSAQKKSEEALQLSERRVRETFVHAPVAIVWCAHDGRFLRVNPAFCELTGYSEAELLNMSFGEITFSEDRASSTEAVRRAANREPSVPLEKRYVRKDGRIVWGSITIAALHNEGGELQHFIGIIQDITERRAIHDELQQATERCVLISRATNDALWDWDLLTGSVWRGEGIVPLFGFPPDRNDLSSWKQRVHPEDRERVEGGIRRALESDVVQWEDEYRFRRGDGSYADVRDRGFILRDSTGKPTRMVGAMQDISERKQAEKRLLEAQHELQRNAVRLESAVAERTARLQELVNELGTFSYSISHDLRAPLRAIHGFAELLRDDVGTQIPEIDRSHLDRIIRAAQRMDGLIRDVLEYSRITRAELTFESLNPEQIVRQIVDAHEQFRAGAEIQIASPIPNVRASRPALMQCFSNLLGNAVKFVAPGTTPRVRVRGEDRGHRVRIWVEDNGIGIAPQNHEKIWGMLERLSPAYEGTGVGLSIVRKAVERMAGTVGVESALGQGSRFWLELPKGEPPTEDSPPS